MTSLEKLEKRVIFERLVIGLEEPVLIKGIGEIQAKVDSGNGGYNVLHGTDIYEEGDMLHFTTVDGQGNPKHVATKLIDRLQVNIGGGHIQDRPVVELDIKFANTLYKKIPFSITDRSDNDLKILIAKSFVDDELNALIDVGEVNISKNNVQVDTVNESICAGNLKNEQTIRDAIKQVQGKHYSTDSEKRRDIGKISGAISALGDEKVEDRLNKELDKLSGGNQGSSSSKTITVKDKESGVAGINMAYIGTVDSRIALGFRLKALYAIFRKKQQEEKDAATKENKQYKESDDDKNWKKKVEKRIKNAYEYSKKYLKKRHRNISQFVQDDAKQTDIDAGVNESVSAKIANKTGLTKAIPAVVSGAGAMVSPEQKSGVLPTEKQNPEHEKYMETLKGAIEVFEKGEDTDKMLDIAYGGSTKPNISSKESIKKEIENLFDGEKVLIKQQKLLDAKMSEAIDSDVKDGFWNSLNDTLKDIADTADQIYRGKFNGSLIGSSIGFFKKWMSGGGLLSKFFKGALAAYVLANPFAALPLTIAYAVQQAARKAKTKQLNVDENAVNEFKESLNGLAQRTKDATMQINKQVAASKNLMKTDQELLAEYATEEGTIDAVKGEGHSIKNTSADGLFPVFDYMDRVGANNPTEPSELLNGLMAIAESSKNVKNVKVEGDDSGNEATEAEEIIYDSESRELFERYSEEAYSVLTEAGCSVPTNAPEMDEKTKEGEGVTESDQSIVDVGELKETSMELGKQAKQIEEFLSKVAQRKKFVLYYVPIEGDVRGSSSIVKEVMKSQTLYDNLVRFFGRKNYNKPLLNDTLGYIQQEFNKAKGEGAGMLVVVNDSEKGDKREVVKGLQKTVYLVDFNHGEEKKEEEKIEADNRLVDVLKDAKRADYPVSLKDFVEQFVGKKAKASDLLSGILQQAKGENYPFSKDEFKKTFMGEKKGNGMMETIKNAIKEIPSIANFRSAFEFPFASKALRKKFNLGEKMPSKNSFKASFNKQIRDKYQVRAGITNGQKAKQNKQRV